jgi:uncharacterized protein involved in exopolysaccharide biosynthesis
MAVLITALTLGTTGVLVTTKQYTAVAYIRGDFRPTIFAGANSEKGASGILGFGAAELVETRSRVLQSHQLAREVLERLGIERLRSIVSGSPLSAWLRERFYGDVSTDPGYQRDLAATRLSQHLSVKTEPRVYQILVQYTADNSNLAALIANAFVTEYLRTTTLQALSEQSALAQASLSQKLAMYGDKHPSVGEARLRLKAVEALFKEQLTKSDEEIREEAGENVTFAQPVAVPSSPVPAVFLGIALLIGLVTAIGLALFIERGNQGARQSSRVGKGGLPKVKRTIAQARRNSA